jgi:rhodanese-related sulfurtransferase
MTRLALFVVMSLAVVACGTSPGAPAPAVEGTVVPVAPVASSVAALPAEVSIADAASMRDAGAFVLDVREPDEWSQGHIPGATLIPLGELAGRVGELPRDRSIVVICRSGNRSAQGRAVLLGAGFPSVTSVTGGMTDWIAAGLPVETGG